jgi:uncharacterized protein YrrD
LGKDLIGRPIFGASDGRRLGEVKDLYLDEKLTGVIGVYLGQDGFLSRRASLIERENVAVFGADAVLAKGSEVVVTSNKATGWDKWIRRDKLQGQRVGTAGGTRVGVMDDVILDEMMQVVGFSMLRVFAEGPIEEKHAIAREALVRFDTDADEVIIDLSKAEGQTLRVT